MQVATGNDVSSVSADFSTSSPSKTAYLLMAALNLFGMDRFYLGQHLVGAIKGGATAVLFGFALEYVLMNEKSILFRRASVARGVTYLAIAVGVWYVVDLALALWNTITFSRSTPFSYGRRKLWSEGRHQRFCFLLMLLLLVLLLTVGALVAAYFRPSEFIARIKALFARLSVLENDVLGDLSRGELARSMLANDPELRQSMEDALRPSLEKEIETRLRAEFEKSNEKTTQSIAELQKLYSDLQASMPFPAPSPSSIVSSLAAADPNVNLEEALPSSATLTSSPLSVSDLEEAMSQSNKPPPELS